MSRIAMMVVAVCVMGCQTARATPLNVRHIPSVASGIIHVDCDALRKSFLLSVVRPALYGHGHDLDPIIGVAERQCAAVTAWFTDKPAGKDGDPQGAAVFEFTDAAHATTFMDLVVAKLGGTSVVPGRFRFTVDGDSHGIARSGKLVFFGDEFGVETSLALATGKARSLAAHQLPARPDPGVITFLAFGKPILQAIRQQAGSQLLKADISSVAVHLGQVGQDLRFRAAAVLSTAESARNIKTAIEGMVALLALAGEGAKLAPLTQRLKLTATGTTVEASLGMPITELRKLAAQLKDAP